MQPFSQPIVRPVADSSTHSMRRWGSPDRGTLERIKGLSEGSSCPGNRFSVQPVHFHGHFASGTAHAWFESGRQQFPAGSFTGLGKLPSLLHDRFGEANVCAGVGAVSAPGVLLNTTLHDSECPNKHIHNEHAQTETAEAAHECTVRGCLLYTSPSPRD